MTSLVIGGALVTVATAITPVAYADSTVTVNTPLDEVQAADGTCSLREATLFANGTAESDCAPGTASGNTTIVIPAGPSYRLRGQVLTLTRDATLVGANAGTTTIDAAGGSQVFEVGTQADVSISDVTVTGGLSGQTCAGSCTPFDERDGNPGGGIINDGGTLTLERVIVTGNHTSPGATQDRCTPQIQAPCPGGSGGAGGGIANFGTTTIADSAITGNTTGAGASGKRGLDSDVDFGGEGGTSGSGGNGGGIVNFRSLTIKDSTIAGNTTGAGARGADGGNGFAGNVPGGSPSSGGDGGSGGGVDNDFGAQLVISGSTISGNETGNGGAGGTGGGATTVKGGDGAPGGTGGPGGGIASDADLTMSNSTVADNSVGTSGQSGEGGSGRPNGITPSQVGGANGGGIEELRMGSSLTHVTIVSNRTPGFGGGIDGDGGTITVGNSISASNHAAFGQNCAGVITDLGGNVEFGDASCPSGFLRSDPRLSPLAGNGGPTQTAALQPGSAAIHHVRTCVLGADQRGVARAVGSACDSGAYQVAPPSIRAVSVSAITTTTATVAASINPNLRDATVVINYGLTPSYGSSTPPLDVGAGNAGVPFSGGLGGLVPGATYHFDVVATNADGQTTTGDGTFTALPPLTASIARLSTMGPALRLTISCGGGSGPGTCSGPITLTARLPGKHRHSVRVAAGSYAVPSGAQRTVKVGLNRAGQTVLTQQYVLATTLSVSGTTSARRKVTFSYPRILSKTPFDLGFAPGSTTFTRLAVIHVPRGGKVTVICHGGGCPLSVRQFVPRHAQVVLTQFFQNRQLRPGTTLQLRIAAANRVAEVETFVIRGGQGPNVIHQCLPPGAARPARCVQNAPH